MQTLLQTLHTELGFELPRAYQAILLAFEQWYAGELANGQEVSFDALPQLLQPFTPNHQNHQRLQQFFLDSAHKYPAGQVYRRDTDALMATETFSQSILMGSGDDGVAGFGIKAMVRCGIIIWTTARWVKWRQILKHGWLGFNCTYAMNGMCL